MKVLAAILTVLLLAGCSEAAPREQEREVEADAPVATPEAAQHHPTGNEAPPRSRFAHIRLFDPEGGLLGSSWPGENGTLESLDPPMRDGPSKWGRAADLTAPSPMWEPILDFLWLAPANATVRLANHSLGDLRVGELVLPKHIELARQATLSREEANHTLRKNLTRGDRVYFLGKMPMDILDADADSVTYRFDIAEGAAFDVERSQGLQVIASNGDDDELVRLTLRIPSGGFVAHNNCQLETKLIEYGYYHVRGETAEQLVLDRYNTRADHALQNKSVTFEIAFVDAATETTPLSDHH